MLWSAEQMDTLRQHWNEGCTCSQIASLLSKQYPEKYTRNSVIGKVHRLHLKRRFFRLPPAPPEPKATKIIPEIKSPPKFKIRKRNRLGPEYYDDVFFVALMDEIKRCDITDIPTNKQCKYIKGDVKSGRAKWCRAPVEGSGSYCLEHRNLVYQRPHDAVDT